MVPRSGAVAMEISRQRGYALAVDTCAFCDKPGELHLSETRASCRACAQRLGLLVQQSPERLARTIPNLLEPEDGEPEPRIRLADGRSVELRERTAQLKQELSLVKRVELMVLLGEIGLLREQALEAAFVLASNAPDAMAQLALQVLVGGLGDEALRALRRELLPV
jgi:hypothetical protein